MRRAAGLRAHRREPQVGCVAGLRARAHCRQQQSESTGCRTTSPSHGTGVAHEAAVVVLGWPPGVPCWIHAASVHCMPCLRRGYLGSGSVDFEGLFRGLAEIGYQGPLTFESFSSAVVSPGSRWGRARLRLQLLAGFGLLWGGCACCSSAECCRIRNANPPLPCRRPVQ